MGPYNVTKAGVVALSETLLQEMSEHGVGVTVLCPTFFQTNILASARGNDDRMQAVVERLMKSAKIDAASVAKLALDAVAARQLYALAGEDGRWMWRIKRLAPQTFQGRVGPALARLIQKRFAQKQR
jgi:short-subunit dehydrogenase